MTNECIISPSELLEHWQGHRNLTLSTIKLFPEKEMFEFSIGGMRTFAELMNELITIALPGIKGIVTEEVKDYDHNLGFKTKDELIQIWNEHTPLIKEYYDQISLERFRESFNLFGQFEFPIIQNIQYFIDNEIHHRAQGFVYLRALGINPPFFWDR